MTARSSFTALMCCSLVLAACAPGDAMRDTIPGSHLFVRAPDGLLDRPDLQEVVEAQEARDVARLRELLRHEDAVVRARAAFALGSVRSIGAGPQLALLLADPEARVRADAAFALGQLPQTGGAGEAIRGRLDVEAERAVRDELIDALGRGGRPPGVQQLLTLDGDDLPAATRALARAFVRNSRPVGLRDTLVARLAHPDPVVRQYAGWALGRVPDVTAWVDRRVEMRNALAGMAQDDPAAMYLVQALGRRPDVFSVPRIAERYRTSTDWRVRSNAVGAMGTMGIGDDQATTVVLGLRDPAPLVRLRAAQVLADAPPIPPWVEAAAAALDRSDLEPAVRGPLLAFLALAGQGERVLTGLGGLALDDLAAWRAAAAALEVLEGQGAVDLVRRGVASPDPDVAALAAGILRRRWEAARGRPETQGYFFAALREALGDALAADAPGAVEGTVDALAAPELVARGSLDVFEARLRDLPPGPLRAAAAAALRRSEAPEVVALPDRWGWPTDPPPAAGAQQPVPALDWAFLGEFGARPRLVLDTDRGRIVAVLDAESAPLTVQTLARVANAGRFDGVPFHRVIPNFVAQGGDLTLARGEAAPLEHAMRSELTRIRFGQGPDGSARVLGMARGGLPDTESAQFFITHSMQPHLDGDYTAFGAVVDGADVVDRLLPFDAIRRARVVPGTLLGSGPG